jgi:Zn-finger nucleic acid-binding protein
MKCPNCKETQLVMSERKGIEIDYCPNCRGVWLDRGELDKIIELSVERPIERERTSYAPVDYRSQKPYKKKSILEELFD